MLRLGETTGFLRQAKGLSPGQALLVQVTGFAEDGKAVPVTDRPIFKGRHAIVTPNAPGLNISRKIRDDDARVRLMEIADTEMAEATAGLILRSSAETAPDHEISGDIAAMRQLCEDIMAEAGGTTPECLLDGPGAHLLAWREWSVPAPDEIADSPSAFADHGVLDALDGLRGPETRLEGGGSIFVEPTRALVAVDVNSGGDTAPAAGMRTNLAAVRALPRQLRLRGLGGQIVVDFAPMPKKERRRIEQALTSAFRADPVETALVGWTPLGHFELQRKRERPALLLR
jgi:Ribonuclease G/E